MGREPRAREVQVGEFLVTATRATKTDTARIETPQSIGTEIDRPRSRAKTMLGFKFDLKGFHDLVLLGGAVPLTILEQVVDQWAASRRG